MPETQATSPEQDKAVVRLGQLGFPLLAGQPVEDLIREAQSHYGLLVDGDLGVVTRRAIHAEPVRFCSVPERASGGVRCRWDKTRWNGQSWHGEPSRVVIPWTVLPEVNRDFLPSLEWAWRQWEKALAIRAEFTEDQPPYGVFISHKRIDGSSGTLAWAQLPCGPDRLLESRIDASERWHLDPETPPARGRIHLGAVMCHEFGHSLGLDHIPTNQGRALLNPMYGPDVLTPQRLDIAEGQIRYGDAADVRPAPPIPRPKPPTDLAEATVQLPDGSLYAGFLPLA